MKSTTFICTFLLLAFIGCSVEQEGQSDTNTIKTESEHPLVGGWELIHGKYGLPEDTIEVKPEELKPLKVFSKNHFSYVMNDEGGSFFGASAGSYVINGNRYTETTSLSSNPEGIGTKTTFIFRIQGDTLFMNGPVNIINAKGDSVKDFNRMEEVRVRAD